MADRRLQVFYTVAKQLSFTKAADILYMTQPAVTFQVKQLEEHFNTRLFERSHGKISLTPAGDLVLGYAERILAMTGEMEARVGELTGQVTGPLMIGASTTIAEYQLPRILGEFKERFPQVQARLTVANSETVAAKVADHSLDVGLIEAPSHNPHLTTLACCEDELVMICSPQHALASRSTVGARDIVEQPYVSREHGSGTREVVDDFFKSNGVNPDDLHIEMELGSREAIKGAVEAGLGVAIMSASTVTKEIQLGTLVAVPLHPRLTRELSMVYAPEKFRSKLLDAFISFVESKFQQCGIESAPVKRSHKGRGR
ncbi:LysR family transcriptional regulator [Thiobacillus sedimenti]|uniref:LysR family transcriptional regulator n=1 Tax=Thiobacillus sedimenti TaxID=3110231 RepID=A0ABZ1CFX1_9PROT|nr:LysR family transcriptional regulator [Thiobacillus sp. SCUT-2]WRS38091.1 LysR family transcriptional regulator [Thiobacillus sp. SCUT-2]